MTRQKSNLFRKGFAVLLTSLVVVPVATSLAQQGPIQRVGQALDNAGKNIRREVEGGVARAEMSVQERDLLARVYHRVHWDKTLVNTPLEFQVQADGTVILRGAVADEAAKKKAADLAINTVGVTKVVDEMVIAQNVIITPAARPVVVVPGTPAVVIPVAKPVIVKP